MIKALNIAPATGLDAATINYIMAGGAGAYFTWAPRQFKLMPQPNVVDESQWGPTDREVKLAHDAKIPTYMCIPSAPPEWMTVQQVANAQATGRGPKSSKGWLFGPDDVTVSGPWAQYVEMVLLRHPKVQGIVVMNEPNDSMRDSLDGPQRVAQSLMSAERIWQKHNATPRLLGPALGSFSGAQEIWWTEQILQALVGWNPPRFGWAHHNYDDIEAGRPRTGTPTVKKVLDRLGHYHRLRRIYLTEGGYQFHNKQLDDGTWMFVPSEAVQEQTQARNVMAFIAWCRNLSPSEGIVEIVAQYMYQDRTDRNHGWVSGLVREDGTPRPLHDQWKNVG